MSEGWIRSGHAGRDFFLDLGALMLRIEENPNAPNLFFGIIHCGSDILKSRVSESRMEAMVSVEKEARKLLTAALKILDEGEA